MHCIPQLHSNGGHGTTVLMIGGDPRDGTPAIKQLSTFCGSVTGVHLTII